MNPHQITPGTDKLHYRETKKISHGECTHVLDSFSQFVTGGNLCTSNPIEDGVCTADSGGPITCGDLYLKGIFSWNIDCRAGKPDVYTDIVAYSKWINDEMAKY